MLAPQSTAMGPQADIDQRPTIQTSPTSGLRRATQVPPDGRTGMLLRTTRHNAMSSKRKSKHPSTYLSSALTAPPEAPPPSIPPPPPPPPPTRQARSPRTIALLRPRPDSQALSPRENVKLTIPSFEEPRRAPQPPKRPPRPPSELFPLPTPSLGPNVKHARISRTTGSGLAPSLEISSQPTRTPPILERSPLRNVMQDIAGGDSTGSIPAPFFSSNSVSSSSRVLKPRGEVPLMPLHGPPEIPVPAIPGSRGPLVARPSSSAFKATYQPYSSSKLSLRSGKAPVPPMLFQPATQSPELAFSMALEDMKVKARQGSAWSDSADEFPFRPSALRTNTAPPSLARTGSTNSLQAARAALSSGSRHQSRSMRARRSSTTSPRSPGNPLSKPWERNRWSYRSDHSRQVRAALSQLRRTGKAKDVRKDAVMKQEKPRTSKRPQSGGKKKQNGEKMSMLVDEGFFPVAELAYGNAKKRNNLPPSDIGFRLNLPPHLSFIAKDLPRTPNSVQSTPIEVYQTEHDFPTIPRNKTRNRRSSGLQRSPLSLITKSNTNARGEARNRRTSDQVSPGGLAAIGVDAAGAENTPPASGATTPVATQIHLRGGSIVTVTPPELTAWKPTVYIHGPIKLPTPAIMPRKNSVASLEPFQEAVDNVYQSALSIPRRRSDDAVVDDICDFFDDFGFELVSFGGDRMSFIVDINVNEDVEEAIERFSTPPAEQPGATPVEVVIAKEVLEATNSSPLATFRTIAPPVTAPPIETEETLRARGIARLSRTSAGSNTSSEKEKLMKRKESLTLGPLEPTAGLPLLPAPEESMLDAVLQAPSRPGVRDGASYTDGVHRRRRGRDSGYGPGASSNQVGRQGTVADATSMHSSRSGGGYSGDSVRSHRTGGGGAGGDHGGFDWDDDDVNEIDAGSSWVAPVAAPKKAVTRGLSTGKTRNPVAKARRLFATASTIL